MSIAVTAYARLAQRVVVSNRVPFGDRLKQLRTAAGLSQGELAKRADLSRQAVSLIENGDREPGWETVVSLAEALGVDVNVFVVKPPELHEPPRPAATSD